MFEKYDIIVVGAGHAGCEAAAASANLGNKTLLITMDMARIAQMSCNPSMGGVAKGQIIKEIDALGGYSGIVTDKTMIQFRMLNKSKGPAMWSPRAQCDRQLFTNEWRNVLESLPNLDFWQDNVINIITKEDTVCGVITELGIKFYSKSVILTAGTFLNGLIHIGKKQLCGGRLSEASSNSLTYNLHNLGFTFDRMKTGTSARLDGRYINFSKLQEQRGDDIIIPFSYTHDENFNFLKQKNCYITHTNSDVHEILNSGLSDSPLYDGTITSIGPRYCPSIETKIVTFSDKDKHQIFLEPESVNGVEYYINGFSSSLSYDIQIKALKRIEGLENIKVFRPGYAIEYDFFHPTQLYNTLETKLIKNLFFAGQINGTTGYEEAAAQGLLAGINAHLKINNSSSDFVLKRDQAYIGVLIDDLVTKGVDEPYRMFTSRAEFRILLRQDNADARLTELSFNIGLANKERMAMTEKKLKYRDNLVEIIKNESCKPEIINSLLKEINSSELKQSVKLKTIIARPEINISNLIDYFPKIKTLVEKFENKRNEIIEAAEVILKYESYIEREKFLADKIKRLEEIEIKSNIDYNKINSLSTEARQKLIKIKPKTIGQASRISGVSPADISILIVYLGR